MLHAVLQKRLAQKARNPKTMIETTNAWAFGWAPAGTMLDSPS
jgi:hypothetical protein